ncbi:serine/threonine-protein kinase Chk2-like [Lineus longissimus]|uniref:serine/threonine-protein kinase Chk2-like n=1 Tax=Lineus longissimus TaxID=88925 RepID=UPI002B4F474C
MASLATQEVGDCSFYSDEEDGATHDHDEIWGRLFPVGDGFLSVDCMKDTHSFGRGESCDYCFTSACTKQKNVFSAYSKVHFQLTREKTSTGVYVFLEDLSSNGTFVNGEKVGKGNKQVLNNNDEIALAFKKNRAFVFLDSSAKQDLNLPEEMAAKYTLTRVLGRGACGEVRLAFEKGSCNMFAVKIISKKKFSIGGKTPVGNLDVMGEVNILKSLKHPCIIGIEDVIDSPDTIYIVLELVQGGELFDKVISIGQYSEATAKLLFYQMVTAIKYLHDQGITHRDLKPENILLASEEDETLIKVTDFGLSKFVDSATMMKTFCGTPNYLAPEILLTAGIGSYTKSIDCWSLGVILYICLVGYPPFTDERKDMDLSKQITTGQYDFPKDYWADISTKAVDLIKKLLTVDPKKRITLVEALNHPWLDDDDVKAKAQKLMWPDGMQPPQLPGKKRPRDSPEKQSSPKKRAK